MKRLILAALLVSIAALPQNLHAGETINGAGATFPYPVYSAWANEYNKITGGKHCVKSTWERSPSGTTPGSRP